MAIFERVSNCGTIASYRYGNCGKEDGLFELDYDDIDRMLLGVFDGSSTTMDEIVRVKEPASGEKKNQYLALRAFTRILRHYKETGEYLIAGGYYA
jgi:hypothetical protein